MDNKYKDTERNLNIHNIFNNISEARFSEIPLIISNEQLQNLESPESAKQRNYYMM